MLHVTQAALKAILVGSFVGLVSACAVTTRSTDGTSETLQNTSDASTDFTSSTSPRDEGRGDRQRARQFAQVNYDRLTQDMARGGGEHLSAFAYLVGVAPEHRPDFFRFAKENYPSLVGAQPAGSDQLLAKFYAGLDSNPTWRR